MNDVYNYGQMFQLKTEVHENLVFHKEVFKKFDLPM